MKHFFRLLIFVPTLCLAAEIPDKPLAQKGELIFSDDFEREDLGEWKTIIPAFTVKDGVLKGEQAKDDHGASVHQLQTSHRLSRRLCKTETWVCNGCDEWFQGTRRYLHKQT